MIRTALLMILLIPVPVFAQSDGELDTTFGTDGQVLLDLGFDDECRGMALSADGLLLAGNQDTDDEFRFFVLRLNEDGNLDADFSDDGQTYLGVVPEFFHGSADLLLQPDGKILQFGMVANDPTGLDFTVVRYQSDGTPDPDFGTGGAAMVDIDGGADWAYSMALQSDGHILCGGSTTPFGDLSYDFSLIRLTPTGVPDANFGTDGKVLIDLGTDDDYCFAIALTPDGKILAAGEVAGAFALIRLLPNGTLDPDFGDNGLVLTDFSPFQEFVEDLYVYPDGRILAAGQVETITPSQGDFAMVRYLADGTVDSSFAGGDGLYVGDYNLLDNQLAKIGLQGDGKIILGGYSFTLSAADFTLHRLSATGEVDTEFGQDGWVTTDFSGRTDRATSLIVHNEIYLSGTSSENGEEDVAVAKYLYEISVGTVAAQSEPMMALVYPNPIENEFQFEYTLEEAMNVRIELIHPDGRLVRVLLPWSMRSAGAQTESLFLPTDILAGAYFLRIETEAGFSRTVQVFK